MAPIVTLTTDFGKRDPYVAAMKGAILGICSDAQLVDLTHDIPPQERYEAAFFLKATLPYFPDRCVHCVVVDPGVGTARRPIVVRADGHVCVGPDNGVFTLLLLADPQAEVRLISNRDLLMPEISPTFHGRDIFGPVAAHLAGGLEFSSVGPIVHDPVVLPFPTPNRTDSGIAGEIIHVDRFGNAISNIPGTLVDENQVRGIASGSLNLGKLNRTYDEVGMGESLALVSSCGFVEIAVNGGSAHQTHGLERGMPIEVRY